MESKPVLLFIGIANQFHLLSGNLIGLALFEYKPKAIKFCLRNKISPLVILPCRRKMFISGAKPSKRVENVLMTWSAPDEHRRQQMTNTAKQKVLVFKNRRLTIKDLIDMMGISEGSVKTI